MVGKAWLAGMLARHVGQACWQAHLDGQDDEEELSLRTALDLIENKVGDAIRQYYLRVHEGSS